MLILRGYKKNGKSNTLDYNPDGSIKNDSFQAHLIYYKKENGKGTSEFHKYLRFIKIHNFLKVDVEGALSGSGIEWEACAIPKEAQNELKLAINGVIELTPEQKKIEELEQKLNHFMGSKSDEEKTEEEEKLENAITEHERLFGHKPHHKSGIEKILKKIEGYKPE